MFLASGTASHRSTLSPHRQCVCVDVFHGEPVFFNAAKWLTMKETSVLPVMCMSSCSARGCHLIHKNATLSSSGGSNVAHVLQRRRCHHRIMQCGESIWHSVLLEESPGSCSLTSRFKLGREVSSFCVSLKKNEKKIKRGI